MEKFYFISYSRNDSYFALRLARDLKNAGIKIWIDQTNIVAGIQWDLSTESALSNMDKLIVILSHTSVKSRTVLDEISFALDNNKPVIPIILEDCSIPFRIRRIQNIEFIKDYKIGLSQLLTAVQSSFSQGTQSLNSNEINHPLSPTVNKSSKIRLSWSLVFGFLFLTILFVIYKLIYTAPSAQAEAIFWESTLKQDDSISYAIYITKFPQGRHAKDAAQKIDSLNKENKLKSRTIAKENLNNELAANPHINPPAIKSSKVGPLQPAKTFPTKGKKIYLTIIDSTTKDPISEVAYHIENISGISTLEGLIIVDVNKFNIRTAYDQFEIRLSKSGYEPEIYNITLTENKFLYLKKK